MIGRLHGPLYILNLNNTDILMRSMTSENEQKDILHRTRVPINCFPIDRPELSVDLFKYITAGEAIRLGWGRAVRRGKGRRGRSRCLYGWLVFRVQDAEAEGGVVHHTPYISADNRHHVSIDIPTDDAEVALFQHNLAQLAKSNWCEHPGEKFRTAVVAKCA